MRGTTHWAECWLVHPECAKRRVEELEAKLARWSPVIEAAETYAEARQAVVKAGERESSIECHARQQAFRALEKAIDAALKEGFDE